MKIKFAVIVFPGSNCDNDAYYALKNNLNVDVDFIWHKENNLSNYDAILIPGGFSYGDYLRTGAIARFSPIMKSILEQAEMGKPIIGICNGFQILLECGLLPGALINNKKIKFLSKNVELSVENNNTIFSSSIGTVFRDEINENLPITSTLGKKQSDFVGQINFNPNQTFQIDYNYMINDNLDEFNFHKFKNTLSINNFVNTFTFYEENNLIGKKSYYENNFSYKIDKNNSLSFKTRENKTDNLTEYYNLIYEYKNDCLTASIRYNKEYYSSSTAKPSEELFFNITLVPLGSTQTESILE